jgi:putative FmdB family regulatory protein
MPIYAYRCDSCGFQKDVLQKISDAPLSQCTSCGADAFRKQVTAAGFQLKGSGWYVTDFRGGNNDGGKASGAAATEAADAKASGADAPAASSAESSKPAGESAAAPAAPSAPASSGSAAGAAGTT